jgi:hypothetical protein
MDDPECDMGGNIHLNPVLASWWLSCAALVTVGSGEAAWLVIRG